MDVFEKLDKLKEKFRVNLGLRIKHLVNNAERLLSLPKGENYTPLVQEIYDKAHKLSGSAKPFGYDAVSVISHDIQKLSLKLITNNKKPSIAQLKKLQSFILKLKEQYLINDTDNTLPPNWKELSIAANKEKGDKKLNIILVDDDNDFTKHLSAQLEEFDYNVTILSDTINLTEKIKLIKPSLLIMDVVFPKEPLAGIEYVNQLKNDSALECPVMFISFRGDFHARLNAVRAGADGYFVKPLDVSNFIKAIDRLTEKVNEKNIRVMIIDDDEYIANLNSIALIEHNAETLIVSDPMTAFETMPEFNPDIILMDIQMPGCDGFELAQVIRQNTKYVNIPIVFLTGSNIDNAWLASRDVGGDDYLTKDISTINLSKTVIARAKRSRAQIEVSKNISEKKARYDALISAAQDGFITTDDKFRIVSWSKGAEELLGYTEQEVYGQHVEILLPKDIKEEFLKDITEADLNIGHPYVNKSFESHRLHKNGSEVPIEINLSEWNIDGKKYFTGIYRDISLRKEIENKLAQNMRELDFQKKTLDEHAIVSIADVKGNITYANDKFCEISDFSREELIGKNHRIIKSEEHDLTFFHDLWGTISSGKTWHGILKNCRKDGTHYWVQSTIVPFLKEDGKPFQYVAIRTDITERVKSEQALRDVMRLNEIIVANSPIGMTIYNNNGDCIAVNNSHLNQIGITREEIIGSNYRKYKTWIENDLIELAEKAKKTFLIQHAEIKAITPNGKDGWFEIFIVPFEAEGETRIYLSSIDITERKVDEELLEQSNVLLEENVKIRTMELSVALKNVVEANQIKSKFIANMSHELRTPLNAILGFSEMIYHQYLGEIKNQKYIEYAEDINKSSIHLLEMINSILSIEQIAANKHQIHKEKFDSTVIITDTIAMLEIEANKNDISISFTVRGKIPKINADKRAMKQISINLMSNAIKFSHKGGNIDVKISHDGTSHVFDFVDFGVGIAKDKIDDIATPFNRHQPNSHIAYDGMGLGLSISKSLAEMHNGSLAIKSEENMGTTITVMIPAK